MPGPPPAGRLSFGKPKSMKERLIELDLDPDACGFCGVAKTTVAIVLFVFFSD